MTICLCDICTVYFILFVFFFKQKTAYEMRISDWSSDVCSSDLTRWSEINVACESCHGPGAKHLVWAKSTNKDDDPGRGLSVSLTNTAQWKFVAAQPPLSDIKRRVSAENQQQHQV